MSYAYLPQMYTHVDIFTLPALSDDTYFEFATICYTCFASYISDVSLYHCMWLWLIKKIIHCLFIKALQQPLFLYFITIAFKINFFS